MIKNDDEDYTIVVHNHRLIITHERGAWNCGICTHSGKIIHKDDSIYSRLAGAAAAVVGAAVVVAEAVAGGGADAA